MLCFQDGQREDSGRSSKFRFPGDKKVTFATNLPRLYPETPVENWLQREFQVRRNSDGQKATPDAKLDRKFCLSFLLFHQLNTLRDPGADSLFIALMFAALFLHFVPTISPWVSDRGYQLNCPFSKYFSRHQMG